MNNIYHAVIDTNVIISALITRNPNSPPLTVLKYLTQGKIIPVYSEEILEEYKEVLQRPKFCLSSQTIQKIINLVQEVGLKITELPLIEKNLSDPKDTIFYIVSLALDSQKTYLVTGNLKHFPSEPHIVSPAEFITIIQEFKNNS